MTEPRLGRWRAPGQRNNPRSNTGRHFRRPPRTRQIRQPIDPEPLVSVQPLVHRRLRRARHPHNVPNGEPVSPPQHYLRTRGNRTVVTILAGQCLKRRPLRFRQIHNRDYCTTGTLLQLRDTSSTTAAIPRPPGARRRLDPRPVRFPTRVNPVHATLVCPAGPPKPVGATGHR